MHHIANILPGLRSQLLNNFAVNCSAVTSRLSLRSLHSTAQTWLDYYEVLGAKRDAPPDEIKRLYLEKCKLYHPDKHQGDKDMHEKFVQVSEAYNTLGNSSTREDYDRSLRYRNTGRSSFTHHDASEYRWGSAQRAKPEDVWRTWQRQNQNRQSYYQEGPTNHYRDFGARAKQQSHKSQNSYDSNQYEDPRIRRDKLNSYWDSVYRQHGKKHHSQQNMNSQLIQERQAIFLFMMVLFILLYIRAAINMQPRQKPTYTDLEPYSIPRKNQQPENKKPPKPPGEDGGITFEEA